MACDVAGRAGTCSFVPAAQPDPTCNGTQACDGYGNCLKASGQPCADSSECASAVCKYATHTCV